MELFNYLKKLHDEAVRLSKSIKFDKKHPRQLHLIGLYGTVIELSGSIVTLVNEKMWTGIPSLFRSILEAHVELKNLFNSAEYGYFMEMSYHGQYLKILNEAKKGTNPFLSGIAECDELDSQISKHEEAIQDLKDKGYYPLNIFQRFEKAGMENEYRSIYNTLSNDAHSNIRALIGRHYEVKNEDFTVVFYNDKPIDHFITYIDFTAGALLDCTGMIHEIFKTGLDEEVKKLGKELNELREKLLTA